MPSIIETAKELIATSNKKELSQIARGYGWRGDEARAPILQLALYVAQQLQAGGSESSSQPDSAPQSQGDDQPSAGQDGQQGDDRPSAGQDGQQGDDRPSAGQDGQQGDDQPSAGQDGQQGDDQPSAGQDGQQGDDRPSAGQDGQQGSQGEQDEEPEPEDKFSLDAEWKALLKASGIKLPHRMLRKVWLLAAKARQNVMLVGPAGSGKTMIAQQLSQLLAVPFSSVSCTQGMSESQLSGWLLPIGKKGKFDYVPAPFVDCLQKPSVFLLDEADAGDSNTLMLLQSILANGFITIPHKLIDPVVIRHADSIIVAGVNTFGGEASEAYTARQPLDAATTDRFYPVIIDYDLSYVHGLFGSEDGKAKRKSAAWSPVAPASVENMMLARDWCMTVIERTTKLKLGKIAGPRMAQRLAAALRVGIPAKEACEDCLIGWSKDEVSRVTVAG
jgi:hypothetical protein